MAQQQFSPMPGLANRAPIVLVADDLPENIQLLKGFLLPRGYEVIGVNDGDEVLPIVEACPPDVILLDLIMPRMDGFDVCRRLKQDPKTRHIPIIIITGRSDRASNIRAIECGADDFLLKPFDSVLLEARLRSSLRAKILNGQMMEYKVQLEESNAQLEARVQERTAEVERIQHVTVSSLAHLAESRDNETGDHIERMRSYAREVALELMHNPAYETVINSAFVSALYYASPLHDIGKVGIPDAILLKPASLTKEEFDIMKQHVLIGGETLKGANEQAGNNPLLAMGRDIAFSHHEKWDGTGYPYGLSGTDIPLCGRICAISDVYDALSSKRPYKEPFSHEKSMEIIREGRGSHFDPDIVDAFLAREEKIIAIRVQFQATGKLSPLAEIMQSLQEQN